MFVCVYVRWLGRDFNTMKGSLEALSFSDLTQAVLISRQSGLRKTCFRKSCLHKAESRKKVYHFNTLSQYPGWIHTDEFHGENLVRKITPRWRPLTEFWPPLPPASTNLHNLFHPKENMESSIATREFLTFTPLIFKINLSILLSPWRPTTFRLPHGYSWYFFHRNIRLNFLVMIEWFLFAFTDVSRWVGNWILSTQIFVK